MKNHQTDLGMFLAALRRYKTPVLSSMAIIFSLSLMVAFGLPPIYRSTATILIEEQEIPEELVRSAITSFADQRLETISQLVMTTANLAKIIKQFNLHPEERQKEGMAETIEHIREDITLQTINAELIDRRSGKPTSATIAFTLSFEGENAHITQQVTSELATLYLNKNLQTRTQIAAESSDFFSEEEKRLGDKAQGLELQLAEFKNRNAAQLPELIELNFKAIGRVEEAITDIARQLRTLDERKFYLEAQLAQTDRDLSIYGGKGQTIPSSETRLQALRAEYVSISAKYSPQHPHVRKMRREIEALERGGVVAASDDLSEQRKELSRLQDELGALKERYSETHPDVIELRKIIAALENAISNPKKLKNVNKPPNNPAYITLKAQLEAVKADTKSLRLNRDEMMTKLAEYEKRLIITPQVEKVYLQLNRDYNNTVDQYRKIQDKRMSAQFAHELEKKGKGERFTLIDPPLLPTEPVKPDRFAIIFLGFALSIGGGLGCAAILKSMDKSIHGSSEVTALLGTSPLAIIPLHGKQKTSTKQK